MSTEKLLFTWWITPCEVTKVPLTTKHATSPSLHSIQMVLTVGDSTEETRGLSLQSNEMSFCWAAYKVLAVNSCFRQLHMASTFAQQWDLCWKLRIVWTLFVALLRAVKVAVHSACAPASTYAWLHYPDGAVTVWQDFQTGRGNFGSLYSVTHLLESISGIIGES